MKLTLDEIKKITDPEERLLKLKEFEEAAQKELDKAKSLAQEGETDLRVKKKLEGMVLPEQEKVNIDELFGVEEKQAGQKEGYIPLQAADSTGIKYLVEQDLEMLQSFTEYNSLDETQKQEVAKIEGKISAFKYVNTSKQVDEMLTASKNIISNIKKYSIG